MVWVIKRQIQKGIHSSTRTVYEWLALDLSATDYWTEERIDAATFTDYEIDAVVLRYREDNQKNGRVLCTMKERVECQ